MCLQYRRSSSNNFHCPSVPSFCKTASRRYRCSRFTKKMTAETLRWQRVPHRPCSHRFRLRPASLVQLWRLTRVIMRILRAPAKQPFQAIQTILLRSARLSTTCLRTRGSRKLSWASDAAEDHRSSSTWAVLKHTPSAPTPRFSNSRTRSKRLTTKTPRSAWKIKYQPNSVAFGTVPLNKTFKTSSIRGTSKFRR